jgi:hypothetical protein
MVRLYSVPENSFDAVDDEDELPEEEEEQEE